MLLCLQKSYKKIPSKFTWNHPKVTTLQCKHEEVVNLKKLVTCYLPLTAFRPGMALLTFNIPADIYDDATRAKMFVDALLNSGVFTIPPEEGQQLIQRLWKGVSPADALSAWNLSTCKGATPWWDPDSNRPGSYTPNVDSINDDFLSNLSGLFLWQLVMHRALPGYPSAATYLQKRLNKDWPKLLEANRFFTWCGGDALLRAWDLTGM